MNKNDLKHLAKLSKIELTDSELTRFGTQMETILESVKTLDELDTSNVKIQPIRKVRLNDLREDTPSESLSQEDVLKNAPFSQDGYVKVYGSLIDSSGA